MLFAEWNTESITAFCGGVVAIITGLTSTIVSLRKRKTEDKEVDATLTTKERREREKYRKDNIDHAMEKWEGLFTEMQERERLCQMNLAALRTDHADLMTEHAKLSGRVQEQERQLIELRESVRELRGERQ